MIGRYFVIAANDADAAACLAVQREHWQASQPDVGEAVVLVGEPQEPLKRIGRFELTIGLLRPRL